MKLLPHRNARNVFALAGLASVAACLAAAAPAGADGYCGQDYTGNSACAINSATTPSYNGSVVANNDTDYYVFYAAANTHLTLTINDNENAQCSTANWPVQCGQVSAELYDAQDNDQGGPGWSSPQGGLSEPQTWSDIISSAGTYYLEVSGYQGQDTNGQPTNTPYTLTVQASPNVQWPPPAPPSTGPTPPPPLPACVVPHYGGVTLTTIEHRLAASHCSVGAVHYEWDRSVRRGRVVALSRHPGAHLANGARVNIWVSRGRKPKHR